MDGKLTATGIKSYPVFFRQVFARFREGDRKSKCIIVSPCQSGDIVGDEDYLVEIGHIKLLIH
ncbi:MAG: hypothetical protein CL784_02840 [Chloroflexi bacterium]|nr:hypothetical protein [Chloroflexota bacterium]|tara:strand:- start:3441 stop:3629 length:189 start_codon:yes stop_codon:yes gene_type:complete